MNERDEAAPEAEIGLYRVWTVSSRGEEDDAWEAFVLATGLGDALEIATGHNVYRINQPISVMFLPTLKRE